MKRLTNTKALKAIQARLRRMSKQSSNADWRMSMTCDRAVAEIDELFRLYRKYVDRPSTSK